MALVNNSLGRCRNHSYYAVNSNPFLNVIKNENEDKWPIKSYSLRRRETTQTGTI